MLNTQTYADACRLNGKSWDHLSLILLVNVFYQDISFITVIMTRAWIWMFPGY